MPLSGGVARAARAGATDVSGSSLLGTFPVLRQSVRNNPLEPAARVDIEAWRNQIRIIKAGRRYADLIREIRMFAGELGAAPRAK